MKTKKASITIQKKTKSTQIYKSFKHPKHTSSSHLGAGNGFPDTAAARAEGASSGAPDGGPPEGAPVGAPEAVDTPKFDTDTPTNQKTEQNVKSKSALAV